MLERSSDNVRLDLIELSDEFRETPLSMSLNPSILLFTSIETIFKGLDSSVFNVSGSSGNKLSLNFLRAAFKTSVFTLDLEFKFNSSVLINTAFQP